MGIYVIEQLQKRLGHHPDISIFDMGTSAFEVLFKLKGHDRIILIDAVMNSNEPVGTTFKLPAEQVEAEVVDDPMVFLHGLKWDQALSYARNILLDEYPEDIQVYLIAIEQIRFNTGMTDAAREGGDKIVDILLKEFAVKETNP
ncbi:MAG: hydrogenase maturation protease [Bacteroidota bacterium]